MSARLPTRRDVLATSAAAAAIGLLPGQFAAAADDNTIRPFKVNVPAEVIADLRQRIAATRWPDRETVDDRSQGIQLAKLQELMRYWGTDYDWRRAEAKLNALPQFMTNIDGVDIHFIHVRSRHQNALPLIVTHGWPGSVIEQLKIIGPLTDPTAHGGSAEDAFDIVIPSLPGYGFSGRPTGTGPPASAAATSGGTVAGKLMWMPSKPAALWRAIALEMGVPQSPPWAT